MKLLIAAGGAVGVYYLYSAIAFDWRDMRVGPQVVTAEKNRRSAEEWLRHAGLSGIDRSEFIAVVIGLGAGGAAAGYALFGGALPALAIGVVASLAPVNSYRLRARQRRLVAHEAWPRIIEEMRILIGGSGRSIPQSLFDAGQHAPTELHASFEAAHREWLLTTDFEQTLSLLKDHLADPTADMVCETLLIAHGIGGTDVDGRLAALAADRRIDMHGRKDARAKQAGARFARRFVLFVPLGMALAGMSVGNGRDAYRTTMGQVFVIIALALMGVCWAWAGRMLQLPEERRVFAA